jgi:3-dehydroquinate dehydratase-1
MDSQQIELAFIKQHRLKIQSIVSYHNYTRTPSDRQLRQIIQRMETHDPAVYKIATSCATPSDAVRLLSLLLELKAASRRCIVLGMGEHGVVTRIFGTLWGNELIFAPDSAGTMSAPGQLTRQQLDAIATALGGPLPV